MAREKLSDKVKRLEKEVELAEQIIEQQIQEIASKSFYQPFLWGVLVSSGLWSAFLLLS